MSGARMIWRVWFYCSVVLVVLPCAASSGDYEELAPLTVLAEKHRDTNDQTYLHLIQVRCAGVLFNVANVFEISGMDGQAQSLKVLTVGLMQQAEKSFLEKVVSPDVDDQRRAKETTLEEVQRYNLLVGARMKRNQERSGDAFGQDSLLMTEMQFCASFVKG